VRAPRFTAPFSFVVSPKSPLDSGLAARTGGGTAVPVYYNQEIMRTGIDSYCWERAIPRWVLS